MSDWSNGTLHDVVELQRGHDLPGTARGEGTVPVIGSFGITGYHDVARYPGPGVAIGRSGASIGVATYCPSSYWPLNTCLFVRDFRGNDPRWVYYLLDSIDFSGFNSGSAQPSLNRNYLKGVPVAKPPLVEQRAIAGVLGALDDKILSNNRIRRILLDLMDASCQGLGDNELTSEVELRDIMLFNYGKALPKASRLVGACPVVGSGGVDGFHSMSLISAPVVVVGRAGQPGRVHLVLEDCWPIDSAFWVSTLIPLPVAWVWSVLKSLDLARLQSGSAVPGLNREIAMGERVILPSTSSLERIRSKTDPSIQRLRVLDRETETLVKIRSLLLPELLSGRLRVRGAEKAVEGVL